MMGTVHYTQAVATMFLALLALMLLLFTRLPALPPSIPPFLSLPLTQANSTTLARYIKQRPVLLRDFYVSGFSVPNPALCPQLGARLRLLILVMSEPSHASARDAVRLTWGHYASRSDVALGFVLGKSPTALHPALKAEAALYRDLIIGQSEDTYSNLTLKMISMLEWTHTFCPCAPRLLKIDDNSFLNVPRLLSFAAARENATRTIWGRLVRKSTPNRHTKSKWYLSREQFADAMLPDYVTGPAYLLTTDCVMPLLQAALLEPHLHLEDLFVMGILSKRLGLMKKNAPEFYNHKLVNDSRKLQHSVAVDRVSLNEQFEFWCKLFDNCMKCAPSKSRRG